MHRTAPSVVFRVVGHDEWSDWRQAGGLRCIGGASYEYGKCCWENLKDALTWRADHADFYKPPVRILRNDVPKHNGGAMIFVGEKLDTIGFISADGEGRTEHAQAPPRRPGNLG